MATVTPIAPVPTLTGISARKLREISAKALSEQSSEEDGLIALTRYNQIYAYVIPVKVAEEALKARQSMASLLGDWKAVAPYVETALESGLPLKRVLNEILKINSGGFVAVDFSGLARLASDTPLRLVSNEDGTTITRADLTQFGIVQEEVGGGDLSRFDSL